MIEHLLEDARLAWLADDLVVATELLYVILSTLFVDVANPEISDLAPVVFDAVNAVARRAAA